MIEIRGNRLITASPRDIAAYSYAEAARIIRMPSSTLRSWKKGQNYTYRGETRRFRKALPAHLTRGLSYNDLAEAFVLRALRMEHGYPLAEIREAYKTAEEEYGIARLFLHQDFRFLGKDLFLDRLSHLASLTRGQQYSMKAVLDGILKRVRYGPDKLAITLYPLIPTKGLDETTHVIVNASISFGRPVVERVGIRTWTIWNRMNAGEDPLLIQREYSLTEAEFAEAIHLEAA